MAQDLQIELTSANERLLKLQKEFNEVSHIKTDLEKELSLARDRILAQQADQSQVAFLETKLKQFDLQIIENQDFIATLQKDLLKCQEQNKELVAELSRVEGVKDGEVGSRVQVYQEEILKVSEQYQQELAEYKRQIAAKDDEIQYHQKTITLKAEKQQQEMDDLRESLELTFKTK